MISAEQRQLDTTLAVSFFAKENQMWLFFAQFGLQSEALGFICIRHNCHVVEAKEIMKIWKSSLWI